MKKFFLAVIEWIKAHMWKSIIIGAAAAVVVATAITLPIVLTNKDDDTQQEDPAEPGEPEDPGEEDPIPPEPKTTYVVSVADVTGGTLSLSGSGEFEAGKEITVNATANPGFTFKTITINGETKATTTPYSFTVSGDLADANKKIVVGATFEAVIPANPYKVSETEWVAAFGTTKPFYIADNYKLVTSTTVGDSTEQGTVYVDGLKLKADSPTSTIYNEIIEGKKYQLTYNAEYERWIRTSASKTVADDIAPSLQLYGENYSAFAFDESTSSYKCDELTYKGVSFVNLTIKFENKQIVLASNTALQGGQFVSSSYEFVYGGQVVDIPAYSLDPSEIDIEGSDSVNVNQSITLSVLPLPSNFELTNNVEWSIEEGSEYASLSDTTGTSIEVTGEYEGTVVIKAKYGELTATHSIEVVIPTATVTMTVQKHVNMGEAVYLYGDFNEWHPTVNSIRGTWTEDDNWVFEMTQPVGTEIVYKFYVDFYDDPTMTVIDLESGPNRNYTFTVDESITLEWQID